MISVVPIHCLVSNWGEWGPLNQKGVAQRTRRVRVKPLNGGTICPNLSDYKNGK